MAINLPPREIRHMHLPKWVRTKRGWSVTRMAKEMGMQVTHYKTFETEGKSYAPARLERLYELSGETLERFWSEFRKDAKNVQRNQRKDAINPRGID